MASAINRSLTESYSPFSPFPFQFLVLKISYLGFTAASLRRVARLSLGIPQSDLWRGKSKGNKRSADRISEVLRVSQVDLSNINMHCPGKLLQVGD